MKSFFISVMLSTLCLSCYCQDADELMADMKDIIDQVPKGICHEERCTELVDKTEGLHKRIKDLLEDEDVKLEPDEREQLNNAYKDADAIGAFLRSAGHSAYAADYMKEQQLTRAGNLLDFSIGEVSRDKYCVHIFQIKLGRYICLLARKLGGPEVSRIKSVIKYDNGMSTSKLDRGLVSGEYCPLWSNADHLKSQTYQIMSVSCGTD